MTVTLSAFREAIGGAGLTPPETILADGKIHRFPSNGDPDDDSGWYVLFSDGLPAGAFGCWRAGLTRKWCAKSDNQMTATERDVQRKRLDEARRQRDDDEQRRHTEAAERARAIWEAAPLAPVSHPYLRHKAVQPHGLRLDPDNDLIVPVLIDGELASLQSIGTEGQKLFLPGGAVKGGSFTLGELQDASPILLCEGFATAASVFEAADYPTVCAFSAGNLLPVAQSLRQQFPKAVIVLAGDNDVREDGTPNVGRDAATGAANAVNGLLAIPDAINTRATDWNDVHVQLGLDAVKDVIEAVLNRDQGRKSETGRTDSDPGLTKSLADDILRTDHFARDIGGHLYAFMGGVYRPTGEERITQRVKTLLIENGDSKRWSSHRAREVVEYIKVDAPHLWDRPPSTVLNLANGLLDSDTQTLHLHSPDHLTTVQLPVHYDPAATCPLWRSFAARVLPADCQSLPFELGASSMCGDVSDQKAVLLVGSGENGKSTLLEAIVSFLGRENVSSLALQRLEIDKFSVVRLLGKLANVCADLPSDHLTSTSTFKALTGGDRLTAERKFQGSFEFTPFARLIFSANHYPQSNDASHAFFRRWNVVPFDVALDPDEKIQNFAAHLSTPGELSGVLNMALAVLPGMIQRGGFTRSESTQAALMEFREMTDPLAAWLDRCTVVNSDGLVTRKDLTIVYNATAEATGRPPMTSKAFCAAVRRLRPTVKDAQRTIRGEVKDVFLGLTLRAQPSTPTTPDGLFPEEVVHDDH